MDELRAWLRAVRAVLAFVAVFAVVGGITYGVATIPPESARPWIFGVVVFVWAVFLARMILDDEWTERQR